MKKIVIADDERNILMLLEIMLRDLDAEVFTATNGEEALALTVEKKPDLVITDVVMPKMNGFEVCKRIRNTPTIQQTPIILLSALGDEYNKLTGFDEGADDYMIKPFNIEELKARASTLLQPQQKAKEEPAKPSQITSISVDLCRTGTTNIDTLLGGGIPRGSNILVHGEVGSGKSAFSRAFMRTGLQSKEKNLFVAIDDSPERIRQELSSPQACALQAQEQDGYFRLVDAYSWSSLTPCAEERYSLSGSLELNQLAGIISDASTDIGQSIQQKAGGRRVIDSISSLLISFDISTAQRFLNQIARTSMAFGDVTTLFIVEKGSVEETVLNNITYIMDGVLDFKKENNVHYCKVRSMKWGTYDTDWVTFSHAEKNEIL